MPAQVLGAVPGRTSREGEDLGAASSARQAGPSMGLAFTVGSRMAAMMVKGPPQLGQCSISISNTRLSNWAQRRRAGAEGGRASPWSANLSLALTGALGMIWGRSLAFG
jgi:hypothetical protein